MAKCVAPVSHTHGFSLFSLRCHSHKAQTWPPVASRPEYKCKLVMSILARICIGSWWTPRHINSCHHGTVTIMRVQWVSGTLLRSCLEALGDLVDTAGWPLNSTVSPNAFRYTGSSETLQQSFMGFKVGCSNNSHTENRFLPSISHLTNSQSMRFFTKSLNV